MQKSYVARRLWRGHFSDHGFCGLGRGYHRRNGHRASRFKVRTCFLFTWETAARNCFLRWASPFGWALTFLSIRI